MSRADLGLFPRPRVLEVLGLGPLADACALRTSVDPSLPAQGFVLDVDAEGGRLAHADDAALRYGTSAFEQLVGAPVEGRIVAVHVEDHPDIAVRAFMLDVSRDRVPTRATLARYVEVLSLARGNQLQLYVEHTFAHVGHEAVWAEASPLDADDLRWLDDRCAAAGIELVVNRNCFGHFERWLRHPAYLPLAEAPEGAEVVPGLAFPPSVLAPTADNAAFALALVREQLACVRSRWVNIGCDETFELGRGASAAACAARGKGAVYLEHVRRIADPLVADGYEVQVWADVLRRHPELAAGLPDAIVPVAWLYEAPAGPGAGPELPPLLVEVLDGLGIDTDTSGGFEANVAPLAEAGIPFWVAPGTSDWCSLVGRWDNAVGNHLDAAEAARRHGVDGWLLTAWGDHGHHHPPIVTWAALLHGAAVAWGLDANRDVDVADVLDRHILGSDGLGGVVVDAGRLAARTGRQGWNASPLAAALFPNLPLIVTGRPDLDAVRDALAAVDDQLGRVERHRATCADADQVQAELVAALGLARQGLWRLAGDAGPSVADRAGDLAACIDHQREAWLGRARPGGLADSLGHLERTLAADRAQLDG
ncbi:MAG: hypothetical protein U0P45_09385 [Acidimicrobiales bacterium]